MLAYSMLPCDNKAKLRLMSRRLPVIMQTYRIVGTVHRSTTPKRLPLHVPSISHRSASFAFQRAQTIKFSLVLNIICTSTLKSREVLLIDTSRDVLAREDRAVEGCDRWVELSDGGDEVRQRLEDDEISADGFSYGFCRAVIRDELEPRGHVDAVHV